MKKAGVPEEQQVSLYLINYEWRLEKIDGKKQGYWGSLYGGLGGWSGILEKDRRPTYPNEVPLNGATRTDKRRVSNGYGMWPVYVAPGERTLVVSDEAIIGRKSFEGTFNFEPGKKYLVRLVTPTEYDAMIKGATWADLGSNILGTLGQSIVSNYIVIVAEVTKAEPTWYDRTIPNNSWIRSKEAAEEAEAASE
jgi:hypothetical protein